jgi:hypothetical protein
MANLDENSMTSVAIRLQEISDVELEEFIDLWLDKKTEKYFRVERVGKANDKGRDVIAFEGSQLHEGPWDLYQCKRKTRGGKLGTGEAISELGKIFYHQDKGEYKTLPRQYVFVSPRGIVGPLQTLLLNPSRLGPYLIENWDKYCKDEITKSGPSLLTAEISKAIEAFDFRRVTYLTAPIIAKDSDAAQALSKVLNLIAGEAPDGHVPSDVQIEELAYIEQLRKVYGEASGNEFESVNSILAHQQHGDHLRLQRTRYFDAASFDRFHRDNTAPGAIDTFKKDVFHSVVDVYTATHSSKLHRLNAVMSHVALAPLSILGRLSRPPVRQGMCHHLASEGGLKWSL